jgi:hypothetical protein
MMISPARELVRNLVEARLSLLDKDQYMFGTIGDKPSGGLHARISKFVSSDAAKGAFHSAASKAVNVVQNHHKAIIANAVTIGLHHVAHIDAMPGDVEEHVHHQIEHLGTTLGITKDMAHHVMMHAVEKLKAVRGIKETVEKDDELDAALSRLHKILKKIEPHYKGSTKPEEAPKDNLPTPPSNNQRK